MLDLKTMIKQEINKDPSLFTELVNVAEVSSSELDTFINKPNSSLLFGELVNIIEYLFPEKDIEILEEYSKRIDINKYDARQALEYLFINLLPSRFDYLNKLKVSTDEENREFAKIYELHYQNKNSLLKYIHLNDIHFNSHTLHSFKCILEMYHHYYEDKIDMLLSMKDYVEYTIREYVNDPFLKKYYLLRFYSVLSLVMLHQNNVSECRRMANVVINLKARKSTIHKARMFHSIGLSYLFEDYEEGIKHLYKAKELYDDISYDNNGDIHSSINLHQIQWGKEPEMLRHDSEEPSDKHDIIYYFVKNKEIEKAIKLIESISAPNLSERDLAFHYFSRGLVDRNLDFMYKSILQFKKIGDMFYIRLPVNELRKQGVNDLLIKTILT